MVLPWCLHRTLMTLPWKHSSASMGSSVVLRWCFDGTPAVLPGASMWTSMFPWCFHGTSIGRMEHHASVGTSMVLPTFMGTFIGLPWMHSVFMGIPWCFGGASTGLAWKHSAYRGTSMVLPLPWNFHEDFHGASMGLPSKFHGNSTEVLLSTVLPWGLHIASGVSVVSPASMGLSWCFHDVSIVTP